MLNENKTNKLLILVPVYNEQDTIFNLISKIHHELLQHQLQEFTDILIINDASTDKSSIMANKTKFKVIENIQHIGYGASLQVGYRYAIKNNYAFVIQLDADGQHLTKNIINIYRSLNGIDKPDIVLGSRFIDNNYPLTLFKKFAIKYFSFIIKATTHSAITDPTSGLQGLNRSVIYYYSKYKLFDTRYPDSNILIEAIRAGFKIKEIPAFMKNRNGGRSMHSGIKPIFYILYMNLAIISSLFKQDLKERYLEAKKYVKQNE